jgi:hypothetical protein
MAPSSALTSPGGLENSKYSPIHRTYPQRPTSAPQRHAPNTENTSFEQPVIGHAVGDNRIRPLDDLSQGTKFK